MKRLPLVSVLFALVFGLVLSSCGDTIRPSAATVNGKTISQEALEEEVEAIEGNAAYVESVEQGGFQVLGSGNGTLTNDFVGRILTRQIFLFLVHEEVERRDLEPNAEELRLAEPGVVQSVGGQEVFEQFPKSYRDLLVRRNAEVAKLQAELSGQEVTDEAVKAFYDDNPALFAQTCVSHILFAVTGDDGQIDQEATAAQIEQLTAEAVAARNELVAGADFAAVAAQRSADASNKDAGGDLECGPPGRFVPEFETAMESLEIGAVSEPVVTQFGVHLIKVTGREPQSLEEATPQIRRQLESEGQQEFSAFLQSALDEAEISVNPRYGTFTKEGQSPGVVPPGAPTTTVAGDEQSPGGQGVPDPFQP